MYLLKRNVAKYIALLIVIALLISPAAQNTVSATGSVNDQFNGLAAEWGAVTHNSVSFSTSLTELKAVKTDKKLYMYVKGSNMDQGNHTFYISSGSNAATGIAVHAWSDAVNVDYKIENGEIYHYENGAWTAGTSGIVETAQTATGIEVFVDLEPFGAEFASRVKIGYTRDHYDFLPTVGDKLLAVDTANIGTGTLQIDADGSAADWAGIAPAIVSADGKSRLYATRDSQNVYIMLEGLIPDAWTDIFLDTDYDASTGCFAFGWGNLGAEYLIEVKDLFASKGRVSYDWNPLGQLVGFGKTVNNGPDNETIMEYKIPLSNLGITSEQKIRIGAISFYNGGAQAVFLPETSDELFTQYNMPSTAFVLDGLGSDWDNIGFVAKASPSEMTLRAVQDHKKLYMLVETLKPTLDGVYFIDSDNNSATGFNHPTWSGSGIDYKIERGQLYKYTGTGASSSWELDGDVYSGFNADSMEVSLNLSQIGKTGPGPMRIGYVGNGVLHLPAGSPDMLTVNEIVQRSAIPNAYYPEEHYKVLNNPLMGWAPLAINGPYSQPHKLVYVYTTWRELEPVKNQFAWDAFEQKYKFDYWADRDVKLVLRIVMDYPLGSPHRDIPDWLYTAIGGDGTNYNDGGNAGFSPNYSNTTLIAEHERLIEAVADRYNNDPRLAYVALGSLGHWGEWHTNSAVTDPFPPASITDQYVQHYIDNFSNKLIGMRRPFEIAKDERLGLFNDMMGTKPNTDEWLDWIKNGEGSAASAMPDFWKYNYSGGEFSYGNPQQHLSDASFLETLRQIKESHNSWIGPATGATIAAGAPQQLNMNTVLKTMGYRYVLESVAHEPKAAAGSTASVAMKWNNRGVAPIYYAYPLELSLLDSNGAVVAATASNADLRTWLPGKTSLTSNLAIPANLQPGIYQLAVAIVDPDTGLPAVDLAISGRNDDGRYVLDNVEVVPKSNPNPTNNPGPTPTPTPTEPAPTEKPDSGNPEESSNPDSAVSYKDVPDNHWAADVIRQASKLKIISGYTNGTFKPGREVSRAEFAVMLARALQLGEASTPLSFKDSAEIPQWSLSSVAQVVQAGIITGYPDGTFRAEQPVTRTEAVVMLVKALELKLKQDAVLPFQDAGEIADWAKPFVFAAYEAGIIQGKQDGRFDPAAFATRAEAVKMIIALVG
ncbi:S-layer homology domain-containing protein [Paenibacillus sp. GXUN7292]|uniref:S-layer homology domain-containing protein n=1 Tax=Paenibacillus sp. GXUN7292 TaxID=3422499 RepID=UPI003D7CFA13